MFAIQLHIWFLDLLFEGADNNERFSVYTAFVTGVRKHLYKGLLTHLIVFVSEYVRDILLKGLGI